MLSESPTRETRVLPGLHLNTSVVSPAAETLIADHRCQMSDLRAAAEVRAAPLVLRVVGQWASVLR
jgi:hypothetical protein